MTTRPVSYGALVDTKVQGDYGIDGSTTTGLTLGIKGGLFTGNDNTVTTQLAGTVALTDDATNFVTTNGSTFAAGTSGSHAVTILYEVTTASGVITVITDRRGCPLAI